ncbi:MAG: HIT domain-containing protein [Chthoniobacteraceae bacterium]
MSFPEQELNSLWSPWRFQYYTAPKVPDFMLAAGQSSDDAAHLVVARRKYCFLMMNRYPYSVGHLMAVPYRKVAEVVDLSSDEWLELQELTVLGQKLLREVVKAHGFNIGLNCGTCAGAGYADHLHLHLVPRWEGDHNFMPVLAGTHIQAQPLDQLYARLRAVLEEWK